MPGYDQKCEELAEYFLDDEPRLGTPKRFRVQSKRGSTARGRRFMLNWDSDYTTAPLVAIDKRKPPVSLAIGNQHCYWPQYDNHAKVAIAIWARQQRHAIERDFARLRSDESLFPCVYCGTTIKDIIEARYFARKTPGYDPICCEGESAIEYERRAPRVEVALSPADVAAIAAEEIPF